MTSGLSNYSKIIQRVGGATQRTTPDTPKTAPSGWYPVPIPQVKTDLLLGQKAGKFLFINEFVNYLLLYIYYFLLYFPLLASTYFILCILNFTIIYPAYWNRITHINRQHILSDFILQNQVFIKKLDNSVCVRERGRRREKWGRGYFLAYM